MNACEDFIETVTAGLIISAALEMLSFDSVDDMPSDISMPGVEELWTLTADERHEHLLCLCKQIYDKFVAFKYNDSTASTSRSDLVIEYSVQLLRMGCFYMMP